MGYAMSWTKSVLGWLDTQYTLTNGYPLFISYMNHLQSVGMGIIVIGASRSEPHTSDVN